MATTAKKATKSPTKATKVFSAEEREAMKAAADEAKRARSGKVDGEADIRAAFAKMGDTDRKMAERIHTIVKTAAPELESKTWYGMPAYTKDGKTICFFQPAQKFKTRYGTLGFQDAAKLDDGNVWPNAYAVIKLTPEDEKTIAALVRKAVG
jgi:uncharacterized protein YdhG (YjbR/CyaY superfamily)